MRACRRARTTIATAYPPKALDAWAGRVRTWADGGEPDDLPRVDSSHRPAPTPRDVFVYVIHEGKMRAPGRRHGADRAGEGVSVVPAKAGTHTPFA